MDEIKAIPRNQYLGLLADGLRKAKESTGIVGDFVFGDAPRTLDQWSYGFDPVRMGRTDQGLAGALYGMRVDPGIVDAAGLAGMVPAVGRGAAWATKEAAGQLGDAMMGAGNQALARALSGIAPRSVIPTEGMTRDQARDLIQSRAESFAKQLREMGFEPQVNHSGSRAGPSSYVEVYDPQTGRMTSDPFRFSNHSKGPRESQFVREISPGSFDEADAIELLNKMRDQGPSQLFLHHQEAARKAREKAISVGLKKLEKGKPLTRSQREYLIEEGFLEP